MSIKDIAVFMFSTAGDEAALTAGEVLARALDADLAAVLLELQPDPVYTMEGAMVSAMWAEVLAEARKGFAKEKPRSTCACANQTATSPCANCWSLPA